MAPLDWGHRHMQHLLQEVRDQMSLGQSARLGPRCQAVLAGRGHDLLGSSSPWPGGPGMRGWWRCLPSVHSLYLSIKPFHPSSGPWARLSPAVTEGPCASPTSAPMLGWPQVGQGQPGCPSSGPWCHPGTCHTSPGSLPPWTLPQCCWHCPMSMPAAHQCEPTTSLSQCFPSRGFSLCLP